MAAPAIPKTQDLTDTIVGQIGTSISQTIPLLPKSFTYVLAKVFAGVVLILYKYAGFIFLQLFVRWASYEETEVNGRIFSPLVEWGRLIGVPDLEAATRAQSTISFTVTNQTGTLPANTQVVRPETGAIYTTTAAVALDAATKSVDIRATSKFAGDVGNLLPGDTVEFAGSPANVLTTATVTAQVTAGVDAETVDSYRERIFKRFQARPQGGAYADYREWSEEVAGIVAAYPYTSDDPGEVDVYVEASEASSGSADGIPTAGQIQAVADSIELDLGGKATRRPATAGVNVYPITRSSFDLETTGLEATADGDLTGLEQAVEAGFDEYLRSREPFIVGLSVLPRRDRITEAAVAGVIEGIASARGGVVTTVTLKQGGEQVAAYTLGQGEKAKAGTVTNL